MADKFFVPGNTDLDASASWSATLYGAGGDGKPIANDVVYIMRGSDEINAGDLDVDLDGITIGPNFSGRIGTEAASITMRCDSPHVFNIQSKGAYVNIAASGSVGQLKVDTAGGAKVNITGGTFTEVIRTSGQLDVGAGCVVTTFRGRGGQSTIEDNATAITTLVQTGGGTTISKRSITTGSVDENARVETWEDETVGTLNCSGATGGSNPATWNHRSSGTITTANVNGGVLTPANSVQGATITTLNRNGGTVVERSGNVAFTIGTNNDNHNQGVTTQPISPSAPFTR